MPKQSSKELALTLPEYNRVFQVAYSILEWRGANTPHSCMFFAAIGALILSRHYNVEARPVAGALVLCTDSSGSGGRPNVISIGKNDGGIISSDENEFHMWVQTRSHVIDFMSPIFHEAISSAGHSFSIPRKMLQRRHETESDRIASINTAGQFLTLPNPELTEYFCRELAERNSHLDILNIATKWFKKYPKKMKDITITDDLGQLSSIKLHGPSAVGAW